MTGDMTRRGVLSGLASTLALGTTASTATAQSTENSTATSTATESEGDDLPTDAVRIDDRTVLLSKEYDGNGTATMTLASAEKQGVTFSDAGAFATGGHVATKSLILDAGKSTVNMSVTDADGYVAVGLSTARTLYAINFETASSVSLSPSAPNDMLALLLGAGVVGPGAVGVGWLLRERRRSNGVVHVG